MFCMPEYYRENIIAEHRFYVDQAIKRLLSQFAQDKIKEEANQAADAYLTRMSAYYNPDTHDPADFLERAADKRDVNRPGFDEGSNS